MYHLVVLTSFFISGKSRHFEEMIHLILKHMSKIN